jgi:TRAP-type C4-dicarboxylate transport system permease small subunit
MLMALLTVGVILSVFLRYVLNISFIWSEELIVFIFIATTYFGIILCVKEGEHIAIDYFKNLFPAKIKLIIETFITAIAIFTLSYLAYTSAGWINTVGNTLTSGLKIHYRYVYIMMPISFTISALYELIEIIKKFVSFKENRVV